jgi:aspartate racemase
MKTIGLLAGMSWESSAHYYATLNRLVQKRLGGVHSAPLLIHSFDFAPLEELQRQGNWPAIGELLGNAALGLERCGAELLLIGANTMHIVADDIAGRLGIPLVHIVDATAERARSAHIHNVGLLGTAYTMQLGFYQERLARYGITAIVPGDAARAECHRIIFEELVRGIIRPESKAVYGKMIADLVAQGAEAIILGCTELMLIIEPSDSAVPLLDTMAIHCEATMDLAFRE